MIYGILPGVFQIMLIIAAYLLFPRLLTSILYMLELSWKRYSIVSAIVAVIVSWACARKLAWADCYMGYCAEDSICWNILVCLPVVEYFITGPLYKNDSIYLSDYFGPIMAIFVIVITIYALVQLHAPVVI